MRVLVTGSNGFIGSHLSAELVRRGHQVRGLVQPQTPTRSVDGLDIELLEGDVRDPAALGTACHGMDTIFHLAAVPSDWAPARLIHAVNVEGTRNLLAAAQRRGCRRCVLMSSLAVHASSGHRNATEDAPRDRHDLPYGVSKRLAEDLVLDPILRGRLEGVVVRPGLVPFGPGDRLFSLNAGQILQKGRLPLINGGRTAICTSYVENLAQGVATAGEHPAAAYETLIIADDGAPTWRDLFGGLATALGARAPLALAVPWAPIHGAAALLEHIYRLGAIATAPPLTRYRVDLMRYDFHFSNARAKRLLGAPPQVSLEEALGRTAAWIRRAQL